MGHGDLVCAKTLEYLQELGYKPKYRRFHSDNYLEIVDSLHALSLAVRVFIYPEDSWLEKPDILNENHGQRFINFCRRHLQANRVTDVGRAFLALAEIWAYVSTRDQIEHHLHAMVAYLKQEEQVHEEAR